MQDRPTARELLDAIADLLQGPVLESSSGPLQHQVRVAGNLCRILEREIELAPGQDARELTLLRELADVGAEGDGNALSSALAARLMGEDDVAFERRAWPALLEIVRGKLAIAKPGHDAYDFADES